MEVPNVAVEAPPSPVVVEVANEMVEEEIEFEDQGVEEDVVGIGRQQSWGKNVQIKIWMIWK